MDEVVHRYAEHKHANTSKDEVNILHLSDLHYGIENDAALPNQRRRFRQKEVFRRLIDTLEDDNSVPRNWKPDVVVISGDIAWRGGLDEYQLFQDEFLTPLSNALGLDRERIITCPGNHDIIRDNAEGFERPYRNQKQLQVGNITRDSINRHRKNHFENYVTVLCAGDPQKLCYSVTLAEWPWVRFLVMNSAWDCRDNQDEGTLRVGIDLLEEIAGEEKNGEIIVSVFHHPHTEVEDYSVQTREQLKRNWLHLSEREPDQEGGVCFSNILERRSDYILNGHIHKETKPMHSRHAKAIQLISGAAYSTDTPKYHCRILKLQLGDEAFYRDIRCTLGGGDYSWEVTSPKDFRVFGYIQTNARRKAAQQEEAENILAKAQAVFNPENSSQNTDEVRAVIQEMMQFIARDSNIENKYENNGHLEQGKEHILETDSALQLKGPR